MINSLLNDTWKYIDKWERSFNIIDQTFSWKQWYTSHRYGFISDNDICNEIQRDLIVDINNWLFKSLVGILDIDKTYNIEVPPNMYSDNVLGKPVFVITQKHAEDMTYYESSIVWWVAFIGNIHWVVDNLEMPTL